MPLVEFNNIYDGLTLGTKVYNKTILRKRLNYRVSPQYATKSKSLTGSTSIFYTHNLEGQNLFDITYGLSAGYQSFAEDAFFTRIRPSISLSCPLLLLKANLIGMIVLMIRRSAKVFDIFLEEDFDSLVKV